MSRDGTPTTRLHSVRGGDGGPIPAEPPPRRWPQMHTLTPYWESFKNFAYTELDDPKITFEQRSDGTWRFLARSGHKRTTSPRMQLTYEPKDDRIKFHDPTTGGGWVLEDAFGGDPYEMRM